MSTPARPRLVTPVFMLVTLANFAYFLSVGALIPTLPLYVESQLGGGDVAVGLAIGMFSVSAVFLRPVTGNLSDRKGRRMLIILGAALVAGSVAAYALVSSLIPLLLLRLVSGAGEAFFYVGVASAINDISPDERRGEALSFFSLALYAGLALGPLLGETVLGDGRFTLTWLVAAGIAASAMILGLKIPDTRPAGLETSAHKAKLINRAAIMPGTVLAASIWGLAGFTAFVPLYALTLGLSGSRVVFAIYSGIVLLIRSVGARLPDKLGVRKTARSALLFSAIGLFVIAGFGTTIGLYIGTAIFAVGQALAFPTLMALAVSSAPPAERGSVVGTFTAFFDLAFGLGAVSLGVISASLGYRGGFAAAACVALGGLGLLFFYARRSVVATEH
ncbi:MAG TPA: MFS transporter [Actinomycetota bacterium]|nr:MFS transporter [Actinomycetota bacterium]